MTMKMTMKTTMMRMRLTQRKEARHRVPWKARSSPPSSALLPDDQNHHHTEHDNHCDEDDDDYDNNYDENDKCVWKFDDGEGKMLIRSCTCFLGGIFEFLRRKWQRSRSLIRPVASLVFI